MATSHGAVPVVRSRTDPWYVRPEARLLEFRILGPLEVYSGGRAVALRGPRQRALLAILLLHAGETVSTDRLIDLLWGETAPEGARKALSVRVSQLRKLLEPAGGAERTSDAGSRVRHRGRAGAA